MEELEAKLKEKERDVLSRDRVIAELRLRLPSTADRDALFDKVTGQRSSPRDENYESSQAIRVATSSVASLQVGYHLLHCLLLKMPNMINICNSCSSE